jgi:NAD(P)-dependent dehydrogenase (short-subunit alcohol dehydrogenase family)
MRFTGKDIAILGGSSGIGLAVARAALEEGGSVFIASSHPETLDNAYTALKVDYPSANIRARTVNVAKEDALDEFFKAVGPFDHLAYTAGEDLPLSLVVNKDLDQARERFEIRYWGALAAAKHGFSSIRAGGSITLTSGFSSMHPRSGWTMQASIQSAVEGLTRALAVELAPIRVNAVSPGISRTPRWDSKSESERERFYGDEEKRLPLGRVGEAAELSTAYLYLMENT